MLGFATHVEGGGVGQDGQVNTTAMRRKGRPHRRTMYSTCDRGGVWGLGTGKEDQQLLPAVELVRIGVAKSGDSEETGNSPGIRVV